MKRILISTYLIISSLFVLAQSAIQAKIDPIEMLIGEQAQVTLTIPADENANIEWPKLQPRQMLIPGVEVINTQHDCSKITLTGCTALHHLLKPYIKSSPV